MHKYDIMFIEAIFYPFHMSEVIFAPRTAKTVWIMTCGLASSYFRDKNPLKPTPKNIFKSICGVFRAIKSFYLEMPFSYATAVYKRAIERELNRD